MKIFVIGGTTMRSGTPEYEGEVNLLNQTMGELGDELLSRGHELVVCSPFSDSADYHLIKGISAARKDVTSQISIHYPDIPLVKNAWKDLIAESGLSSIRRYPSPGIGSSSTSEAIQYAWLFAQLNALDSCAGVITIGGKPSGSLNLLFHLADARNKRVLPLTYLGGAAQDHFDIKHWDLRDHLADKVDTLDDITHIGSVPDMLESLLTGSPIEEERSFFISYSRARPSEADYVETLLRRRGHVVYRDEENFEPSADTQEEIIKNIKRANVFVALWCRDYACSPWCFDELEMALERKSKGLADLWIFCVDDTRIVPRAARDLNYYQLDTREKIEGKLLFLLNKLT